MSSIPCWSLLFESATILVKEKKCGVGDAQVSDSTT